MSETQWPLPFVGMYQRILRIKHAMDQEEASTGTLAGETPPYDRSSTSGTYNALFHPYLQVAHGDLQEKRTGVNSTLFWNYLEKWQDWEEQDNWNKTWQDWERWDSWTKTWGEKDKGI